MRVARPGDRPWRRLSLAGCGGCRRTPRRGTTALARRGGTRRADRASRRCAVAQATHEYPSPAASPQRAPGSRRPERAIRGSPARTSTGMPPTCARAWACWRGPASARPARRWRWRPRRREATRSCSQGGIANRGTVEAVAPLARRSTVYVVVTREWTDGDGHDGIPGAGAGLARDPGHGRSDAARGGRGGGAGSSASGSPRIEPTGGQRPAEREDASSGGRLPSRRCCQRGGPERPWRFGIGRAEVGDARHGVAVLRDRRHMRVLGAHGVLLSICSTLGPSVLPVHLHDLQALPPLSPGQGGPQRHLAVVLSREPRSACSATTAPASRRCCGSWPGSTPSSTARRSWPRARPSGSSSRSRSWIRARTCKGNVEEGVAEVRALLDRFNELSMNYSDETADEFARVQEQIDAADAWNLDTTLEIAMDALRCPPPDADVSDPVRRRAPPRGAVPAAAAPARPAAAGRADQPPRRRVGGLARGPPARLPGHDRRRHPRPVLPGQRRRLDPRARSRSRDSLPGQLLRLAGAEAGPAGAGGEAGEGAQADDRAGAGMGADERQRPAQQARRRGSTPTRRCWPPRTATSSSTRCRSTFRPARGWATWWSRPTGCARPTATVC